MDRAAFFASLRARNSGVFGTSLSQGQVSGCEAILDEAQRRGTPLRQVAYMLATSLHETAATMQPITEYGKVSYFDKYEPGTKIGRDLGNTVTGDGYRFRGRGYVQLTGRRNYRKASEELGFDIVANPARALEPPVAAAIMFLGMTEGWFTTRKLSDYILGDKCDYVNARRIINGTDKAQKIAGYAEAFATALRAGVYIGQAPVIPPGPPPAPVQPAPVQPTPVVVPTAPTPPAPAPAAKTGFLAALLSLFKRKS